MAAMDILRAFSEEPPPFDFVLPGMLAGTVGFILSPGGAGKSMLALEAACAIAGGVPEADLLGLSPVRGRALYIAAEDPEVAIWHRLHAMGKRFATSTREAIAENLTVQSIVGHRPDIMSVDWQDAIIAAGAGHRIITIDTLTRFHQLDENSNGDMGRVISTLEYIAKETGAAILVIHHSSKAMAVAGRGDEQQSSRGASSLIDNARWAANMMGMTKDESMNTAASPGALAIGTDRTYYVRFAVSKQNHGKPFEERWYVRADGGVLVPVTLYPVTKGAKGRNDGL